MDFLVIADPTSSLISPKQFDEFAKTQLMEVTRAFSGDTVLHICGRSGHLLKQMAETGAAGLSLDENVKLTDAIHSVPKNVVIFGNYSPTRLGYEKPNVIQTEVKEMLSTVNGSRQVVASTGCDISASTPEINIQTFIQTAKSYSSLT